MPQRVTAWPHIDPGKKRHQIQIQAQGATTQDATGQPSGPWNTVHGCWAAIETKGTKEQFQAGFVSQVFHEICIDWPGPRIQIRANMQVVVHPLEGQFASVYEIQSVENVQQRNLVVRLVCLEIDNKKVGQESTT
jgi:head-tail adaptor